jgi:hypothetical protein
VPKFVTSSACVLTGCALLFLAASGLLGQATTATILGTVSDPSGAAIPGATVQVRNTGTSQTQEVVTDAQGRYRVPELGLGERDSLLRFEPACRLPLAARQSSIFY